MASIQFSEADRDEQGFVKAPAEPRSLADLLPKPADIRADAQRITPQKMTRVELGTLAAVALCAAFVIIYAWATPRAPTPTPTPRVTVAPTFQPTAAPTAAAVRLLAAFASPDGVTLGTVEETRAMTPTARFGTDWIQADVAGSGLVWFRAEQLKNNNLLLLPDLAPPTPRPAPAVQPVAPPVASPAPTRCAEVGISGKMAQACGTDDLAALQAQAQEEWTRLYGSQFAHEATPTR